MSWTRENFPSRFPCRVFSCAARYTSAPMSDTSPNSTTRFCILSSCVVGLCTAVDACAHHIRSLESHSPQCVWWQVAACSASIVTAPRAAHHRSSSHKQDTHHIFGTSLARSILEGQHVLAFSIQPHLSGESSFSSQFVPVENLC